eukprot:8877582-Heterocapsa_arctica.AAC.1
MLPSGIPFHATPPLPPPAPASCCCPAGPWDSGPHLVPFLRPEPVASSSPLPVPLRGPPAP